MDNQQAFTTIVTHLAQQARRALSLPDTDTRPHCQYRGAEGRKCAIGVLIPDGLYDPEMDAGSGMRVDQILDRYPAVRKLLDGVSPLMLSELQQTHDKTDVGRWPGQVRRVAKTYELTLPEVDWSACEAAGVMA